MLVYPIGAILSVVVQTVSFDLRDFFRLPTKTPSRHYNTTKLPYFLNRVHILCQTLPSKHLGSIII